MNNNNLVANSSSVADTKPSTEHLMNSISSLSAYAGLPNSAKRLPEGRISNFIHFLKSDELLRQTLITATPCNFDLVASIYSGQKVLNWTYKLNALKRK